MNTRLIGMRTEQRAYGSMRKMHFKGPQGRATFTIRHQRAEGFYEVELQFYAEPGKGQRDIKAYGLGDTPRKAMQDLRKSNWIRY